MGICWRPDDPQYKAVVDRQFNKRLRAAPDYVRAAQLTDDVIAAVEDAVREGRRLVVTSGGHCLEGFVSDPDVRVIVDVSPMTRIYHDAAMGAIAVECGATVGDTFRALAERWGAVVPLGEYPGIGMGGHVVGGAFGFLCRQHGLAADYLHAVEVVIVGADGRARSVVATRDPSDPHHDLWWAHTGGGGGNFGVVTRYWFRSADASGGNPAALLPRAPQSITTFRAEWRWADVDRRTFLRLLQNHGRWSERHAAADSPYASLWSLFEIHRQQFGTIVIRGLSTAGAAAEGQIDDFLAALSEGTIAPQPRVLARMSWLEFALNPFPDLFTMPPGGVSSKGKDALLKRCLSDRQIVTAYDWLTSTDHDVMGGMFAFASYGGRINTVAPEATASPHRRAILDMAVNAGWLDPREEAKTMAWVRGFWSALLAESGGAPVPGPAYDGTMINHPDTDLADPAFNTSGVPWPTLYYQSNYGRLQRVKSRWDPRNVFRHTLSIQPEDEGP
jgi:FAD/FMN-containing dehydrogenases